MAQLSPPDRPRTATERGQTTQDFATGIGIFLLTIAVVFLTIGTLGTPFESGIGGAETAQADRIADRIVEQSSESGSNELTESEYQSDFAQDPQTLTESLGLRASSDDDLTFDRVNITVTAIEGDRDQISDDLNGGHTYDGQTAASSSRIVTIDDEDECNGENACRLTVRVW